MLRKLLSIFLLFLFAGYSFPVYAESVRIKNLVTLQGTGSNKLIGYGLVVGLNQTGDRLKGITNETIANLLKNLGNITVDPTLIQTEDTAAVIVTANLSPYSKSGDSADCTVSAIGDATSLQGGTLLLTPLRAANGKVYALAQGPVSVGGLNVTTVGVTAVQQNYALVGRVPNGALIIRAPDANMLGMSAFSFALRHPDFGTAAAIVKALNENFGAVAQATDPATIEVAIPQQYQGRPVEFIAKAENLKVTPDQPAEVVINERTGTVVMGGDITLSPVAIAHGNLTITIQTKPVFPPTPTTLIGPPGAPRRITKITVIQRRKHLVYVPKSATLQDVVDALNALNVTPRDLISILQALKAAGALHAHLKIL
ncbi:MAG: flagellar basal body P-ring protein FlgI [Firmicutes bacterium]|nr:flagellar basal body P-ring protein FlgI [Bacillota bacterium]